MRGISDLIATKEYALQSILMRISVLEDQLVSLRAMAESDALAASVDASILNNTVPHLNKKRNQKGLIKRLLLETLTDIEQSHDDILERLNVTLTRHITRGALRTALMNLRKEGLAESSRQGMYCLKQQ